MKPQALENLDELSGENDLRRNIFHDFPVMAKL